MALHTYRSRERSAFGVGFVQADSEENSEVAVQKSQTVTNMGVW